MATEYRVVVETRHGTTRRIEMGKQGRDDAERVGDVYLSSATPYYEGSTVEVQAREVGCWHPVGLFDGEDDDD